MSTEPNHVKTVDDYKAIERLYLPRWIAEKIRTINYDLVDHMREVLISNPVFNAIYRVEVKEIDHLRRNHKSLGTLLAAPFLMLSPSLHTVEDWRCFVDATPTTRAVDELLRKMPAERGGLTTQAIQLHNRQFVDVIRSVANTSILSAPLLGMTPDLARYLGDLPGYKLRTALERIRDLPLFQWRFTTPAFWFEFTANDLLYDQVAHHIMSTTPFRAGELPHTANWADLRLGRETHEMYAAALMAH